MSGLGEAVLEGATDRKPSDEPVIVEMARSISGLPADTKMTLVPTGPLTNITLFPRTYSGRADRIDRIVLMGGTTVGGNATGTPSSTYGTTPRLRRLWSRAGYTSLCAASM